MNKYADYYAQVLRCWPRSGHVCRDIGTALKLLVLWYVGFVALIIMFQRYLIYFPEAALNKDPSDYGLHVVHYDTVDDLRLMSWYAPPQNGKPVIVMFHGNAGNISRRVPKAVPFTARGYGFLLAGYRGFGGNPGWPSENGLYTDARAALTWLKAEQGIKENDIVLYGESIGSGVVSQMALEYPDVRALVLEAPFSSVADVTGQAYFWLRPLTYLVLDRFDNAKKAPYFDMPVLIAHGSKDEIIPPYIAKKLYDAVGSETRRFVLIDGGGHSDLAARGYLGEMRAFIEETAD
ncbi:MAG: alpha/beta hydrolase [Alphaproteobacteria bacterium]|nr:alpha/beta hydrolase [Alphaproteobacteria bacterium]